MLFYEITSKLNKMSRCLNRQSRKIKFNPDISNLIIFFLFIYLTYH